MPFGSASGQSVVEIHEYTVKDGVMKYKITKEYASDEWLGAGRKPILQKD